MIVRPECVATYLVNALEELKQEVLAEMKPGEKRRIEVQFFDCVPFYLNLKKD